MSLRAIPLRVRLPVAPIHILLAGQFDSFTVAIQFSVGYIGLSFRYTDTGNREMNFCDGRREEKCIVWQERCRYVMSTCLFFIPHSFSWPYPLFFFASAPIFFCLLAHDSVTCPFYTMPISKIDLTTADWYVIHHRFVCVGECFDCENAPTNFQWEA